MVTKTPFRPFSSVAVRIRKRPAQTSFCIRQLSLVFVPWYPSQGGDHQFESGRETLDELLPEAFAAVREASGRALGMRHFPVQLMGGVVLHRGMIAEMRKIGRAHV